ncbi:MAG TPA: HAMP domain-containing sensor histidine kinase [Povalibacter sp.]|nr:HAMP domain-containing sensor histidine kinase [Povalibacter sp.]
MNPRDTRPADNAGEPSAKLLEELLQIARSSALEEMASGIAHELNQPIGAIATFAQAGQRMLNRPQPMLQSAAEVLQHISDEALKAGDGIHRIRKLFDPDHSSRIDCHLADVIGELLPVLQLLARRAGASVSLVVGDHVPLVSVDRRRVQHVIYTLVQNALEACGSAAGDPQICIDVTGDRYAATTSVLDPGPGIAPEAQAHLFRPFFTTKPNGTGLGLASSRAIVEAHHGTIGFDNAVCGSTRFWFRLPAATGASG